jgi:hypothetical protein
MIAISRDAAPNHRTRLGLLFSDDVGDRIRTRSANNRPS